MIDEYPSMDEAPGIVLDSSTHRYYYVSPGARPQPVAGVTEILKGVGIISHDWVSEYALDRGTQVHKAMQLLIQGRLDWSSLDERIAGYVKGGAKFCAAAGVELGAPESLTEHLVYSRTYGYAGKLDAFLSVFGRQAIVDWKSGVLGLAHIQTSAYAEAFAEERGIVASLPRYGVQLFPDGDYKLTPFKASRDFDIFRAAALLYNTYHLPKRKDDQ